jgi:DNA-binding MurR/RpiR family transcriptional regulator
LLPSLPPSDARAAKVILNDPAAVVYGSVSQVAEAANTSASTVVRCAQRLDFTGFHSLKLALAQELALLGDPSRQPGGGDDDAENILTEVLEAGARTLTESRGTIDLKEFSTAIDRLDSARRVLFVGVGTSAPLAQDAAYRFRAIGLDAEAQADTHIQHLAARRLRAGDVCVAVSHTGSTQETNGFVRAAKASGACTIAITSFARSPLTELVDVVVVAGSSEVSFRLEAMASRLAHLGVLDALLVGVAHADPDRSAAGMELFTSVLSEHRA